LKDFSLLLYWSHALEVLHIEDITHDSPASMSLLLDTLIPYADTLKSLTLDGCFQFTGGMFEKLGQFKKLEFMSLPSIAFEPRPYAKLAPQTLRRIEYRARYAADCRFWSFNEQCAERLKRFAEVVAEDSAIKEIHVVIKPGINDNLLPMPSMMMFEDGMMVRRPSAVNPWLQLLEQLRDAIEPLGIRLSYVPPVIQAMASEQYSALENITCR
jgi:hypothetical protein